MSKVIIGIDHGNGNMKTTNVVFPCGFKAQETEPSKLYAKDVIKYKDMYYILTPTRFAYQTDKTIDDKCFVLTLFAIAKEIQARYGGEEKFSDFNGKDVVLAVGLPPLHYEKQQKTFKKYFIDRTRNGVEFTYNGHYFNFYVSDVMVFPQDYAAAVVYEPDLIKEYSAIYCIDIGDSTVDMVGLYDGIPNKDTIYSRETGMSHPRQNIISDVINDNQVTLTDANIEDFLKGKKIAIAPDLQADINARIQRSISEYVTDVINQLHSKVADFRVFPVIFCGGGAKMLEQYFIDSKQFGITKFIDDISANASGFETIARMSVGE